MPDSQHIDDAVLKIAVPSKGRLSDPAVRLLKLGGLRFRRRSRRLYCTVKNMGAAVIFANAADVPTLVAEGVVDLGISGQDLVRERCGVGDEEGARLRELLPLGFGRCKLSLAVRESSEIRRPADLAGCTLGTSFPHAARVFLDDHEVDAHLIPLNGSLEVMVALGLVDAIVELVETGDSLRENRLIPIVDIASSEAVLVGRDDRQVHPLRDRMVRRIQGVVDADRYVVCEYNLPVGRLDAARAITPGHTSPTVAKTEDPQVVAIKVMVERGDLPAVMDRLEAIGATAIFATEITNCRL